MTRHDDLHVSELRELAAQVEDAFNEIMEVLAGRVSWTRRDFADLAAPHRLAWALFSRLDGKDYESKLWRAAKPDAVGPAGRVYSEDVA